jgi:hypothetical protein
VYQATGSLGYALFSKNLTDRIAAKTFSRRSKVADRKHHIGENGKPYVTSYGIWVEIDDEIEFGRLLDREIARRGRSA